MYSQNNINGSTNRASARADPKLGILASPAGQKLLSFVAEDIYDESYMALWLYQVMGLQLDDMLNRFEEIRGEAFSKTADWSLSYWEHAYGIEIDETLKKELRRQRILSKTLEYPPINPARIKQIAEINSNGIAEVTRNVAPYTFRLTIVSDGDKPLYYNEGVRAVRRAKPSHISIAPVEFPVELDSEIIYIGAYARLMNEYNFEVPPHDEEYKLDINVYTGSLQILEKEYNID